MRWLLYSQLDRSHTLTHMFTLTRTQRSGSSSKLGQGREGFQAEPSSEAAWPTLHVEGKHPAQESRSPEGCAKEWGLAMEGSAHLWEQPWSQVQGSGVEEERALQGSQTFPWELHSLLSRKPLCSLKLAGPSFPPGLAASALGWCSVPLLSGSQVGFLSPWIAGSRRR